METMEVLTDIAERVAEYRMFYPDTTLTTISSNSEETFSDKQATEPSPKVGSMTRRGRAQSEAAGKSLFIFKSRAFLKVAEGFKEGARVRFHDPRTPDIRHEAYLMSDGIQYRGGIAMINQVGSDDPEMEWGTYAVYYRPVEEGK